MSSAPLAATTANIAHLEELLREERAARQRAEAAICYSEAFGLAIFQNSADCVKVLDSDGRIDEINLPGQCLLEIDDFPAVRGRWWPDFWQGADRQTALAALESARLHGTGRFQGVCLTAKGTPKWWDVVVSMVSDADGGRLRFVVISRDIAEQRSSEQERERLLEAERQARDEAEQALALRDEVLSGIAHDLKNPLTAIRGAAQLLLRRVHGKKPPDGANLVEGLLLIDESTARIATMIDDLLDAARLKAGQQLELRIRPTDLVALVRQVVESIAHSRDEPRGMVFDTAVDQLVGEWDPLRLERVTGNLLSNAVKYSSAGSLITVNLMTETAGAPDPSWAVLVVRDLGIGIPAADLPHVFERFHRAANVPERIAGSGIGLAAAKQLIEQHGGSLTVDSIEGRGTTVTMRLPLCFSDR